MKTIKLFYLKAIFLILCLLLTFPVFADSTAESTAEITPELGSLATSDNITSGIQKYSTVATWLLSIDGGQMMYNTQASTVPWGESKFSTMVYRLPVTNGYSQC